LTSDVQAGRPVALVTGASSGIGWANVLALATAGVDVATNSRRSADAARETATEANAAGASTLPAACDVSDDSDVRAMVREIEARFGRLDALVNNAGTTSTSSRATSTR
jgi:3-oxoacyl-[acyl-carrier protein] reductase